MALASQHSMIVQSIHNDIVVVLSWHHLYNMLSTIDFYIIWHDFTWLNIDHKSPLSIFPKM